MVIMSMNSLMLVEELFDKLPESSHTLHHSYYVIFYRCASYLTYFMSCSEMSVSLIDNLLATQITERESERESERVLHIDDYALLMWLRYFNLCIHCIDAH